ncbi:uncharacterized protein LOC124254515 [Haliotis rubra]|uniref:uncharacterized protein LOC124254515 n=1 Tax=Haliotis rubra TaxID=36100 RepID=UPI001EE6097F|nr:uncharacterized protein LOC124254515 [Haliotis rubra]
MNAVSHTSQSRRVSRTKMMRQALVLLLLLLLLLPASDAWWNRSRLKLVPRQRRPSNTNTNANKCQALRDLLTKTRLTQRDISLILNVDEEDPVIRQYKQIPLK